MLLSSFQDELPEAGCDEAGRGCLAGPVVAAAVILPKDYKNSKLNDSKKLSVKQRDLLKAEVIKDAIAYAIGIVDNHEIDQINILNASIKAMHIALESIQDQVGLILVDGNRFHPFNNIPHECVIKGDGKFLSIAAASILAKTTRDHLMRAYHTQFPSFGWDKNKGYPTKYHRDAIREHGPTKYHRLSFNLLPTQYTLF